MSVKNASSNGKLGKKGKGKGEEELGKKEKGKGNGSKEMGKGKNTIVQHERYGEPPRSRG